MAIFRVIPAGDLDLVRGTFRFVEGTPWVRQKLAARFQFAKGEWFADLRQGIPYFESVFRKNPDLGLIRSLFRRVLITTPGVASIKRFELVYDEAARRLAFDFHVHLVDGGVLVVSPADDDFIVEIAQ